MSLNEVWRIRFLYPKKFQISKQLVWISGVPTIPTQAGFNYPVDSYTVYACIIISTQVKTRIITSSQLIKIITQGNL